MEYHREDYMFYWCYASVIIDHDHWRRGDLIELNYPKPVCMHDFDTEFKLGLAQFHRIPFDVAKKALKI